MALLISIGLLYFFLFVCSSQVLLLFLFVIVTFICYCFFLLFACSSQVLAERQDRLRACLALFPAVDFKFIFIYPSLSSSSPFSSFLPSSFFSFIFIFTFLLYLHLHPHPLVLSPCSSFSATLGLFPVVDINSIFISILIFISIFIVTFISICKVAEGDNWAKMHNKLQNQHYMCNY